MAPAVYTPQTCSRCGCRDKNSRKSQPLFRCTDCGFSENAVEIIKLRAVDFFLAGKEKPKEVEKTMRLKYKQACAAGTLTSYGANESLWRGLGAQLKRLDEAGSPLTNGSPML